MSHTQIAALTTTRDSDDLACRVRRVYGFRAECDCGWKGHTWTTTRDARLEASFHVCAPLAA